MRIEITKLKRELKAVIELFRKQLFKEVAEYTCHLNVRLVAPGKSRCCVIEIAV